MGFPTPPAGGLGRPLPLYPGQALLEHLVEHSRHLSRWGAVKIGAVKHIGPHFSRRCLFFEKGKDMCILYIYLHRICSIIILHIIYCVYFSLSSWC